jgi:uncharacterized membrane protein ArfC
MNHVHWWLVALSFVIGLVLMVALMVRRVKRRAPVGPSAGKAGTESESPTTGIGVAEESPKIPVAKESPTTQIPVAKESPTTQIPVAKESPTTQIPIVPYTPHGPGSARATPDGGGPSGWLVKGRSDTRLYYTPDDPNYDAIVAQVWFNDEESARRANFTPWRKSSRK